MWRKSSYSASGDCPEFRVSSYCNAATCVQAGGDGGAVLLRDSKDPDGPVLSFPAQAWAEFTGRIKTGALDLP